MNSKNYSEWSKLPFPDGWDRAWDNDNKCVYYIDHNTKNTSWMDPRIEIYKKMMLKGKTKYQKPNHSPSSSSSSSSSSFEEDEESDEDYDENVHKVTEPNLSVGETLLKKSQSSSQNSVSHTSPEKCSNVSTSENKISSILKPPAKVDASPNKVVSPTIVKNNKTATINNSKSPNIAKATPSSSRNSSPAKAKTSSSSSELINQTPISYKKSTKLIPSENLRYKPGLANGPCKANAIGHDSNLNKYFKVPIMHKVNDDSSNKLAKESSSSISSTSSQISISSTSSNSPLRSRMPSNSSISLAEHCVQSENEASNDLHKKSNISKKHKNTFHVTHGLATGHSIDYCIGSNKSLLRRNYTDVTGANKSLCYGARCSTGTSSLITAV